MALSDNLVAYWKLTSNNLVDEVSGLTLVASNAAYNASGGGTGGWGLTSSAGYIRMASGFSVATAVPITMAAKVYIGSGSSASGDYAFMVRVFANDNYFRVFQWGGDTTIAAGARNGATEGNKQSASHSGVAWHNVAGMFTANNSRTIYLDSTVSSAETTSVTPTGSEARISLLALSRPSDTIHPCPTSYYITNVAVWAGGTAKTEAELDEYFADPDSVLGGGGISPLGGKLQRSILLNGLVR